MGLKSIIIEFLIDDEAILKETVILQNESDFKSDSTLVKNVCYTTVKAIIKEGSNAELQDILNDLNIEPAKK